MRLDMNLWSVFTPNGSEIEMVFVIGGAIAAVGAIGSSVISSNAAQSAASKEAAAAQAGQALSESQFNKTQSNLAPFIKAGQNALPQLNSLLGLGPSGGAGQQSALENLPGYQFAKTQGEQAVTNQFAAQGLAGSGAAAKGAINYAEGLANSNWLNYITPIQTLVGSGQNAANGLGSLGLGTAQTNAQLGVGAAQAGAAGTVGSANAITGAIGQISSNALTSGLYLDNKNNNNQTSNNGSYWVNPSLAPDGGSLPYAPTSY